MKRLTGWLLLVVLSLGLPACLSFGGCLLCDWLTGPHGVEKTFDPEGVNWGGDAADWR